VIPFLYIYFGFYDIAFTPLLFGYVCEIWPYTLRARGVAVTQVVTQLAVFFNIFVNPIALEAIAWKYYLVYVVILVLITLTIYFLYPRTNGHSLEEMVAVFDGKAADTSFSSISTRPGQRRNNKSRKCEMRPMHVGISSTSGGLSWSPRDGFWNLLQILSIFHLTKDNTPPQLTHHTRVISIQ